MPVMELIKIGLSVTTPSTISLHLMRLTPRLGFQLCAWNLLGFAGIAAVIAPVPRNEQPTRLGFFFFFDARCADASLRFLSSVGSGLFGPIRIVVSGAVRSITKLCEAGVGSTLPAASNASTENV